jgi:hypothetical protein
VGERPPDTRGRSDQPALRARRERSRAARHHDADRTLDYTYDGLQRLAEAVEDGPTATTTYSYTYDLAGNRQESWTDGVQLQNFSYDDANQVVGWSYDAAGNLVDDGTAAMTFDPLNRLIAQGSTTNTTMAMAC